MSWNSAVWHHEVHERFDEQLFYFLVQVRPLKLEAVERAVRDLIKERQLGSVRVFPVFGTYDLLIRAWLPSRMAFNFRGWLITAVGGIYNVNIFFVTRTERRWYSDLPKPPSNFQDHLAKLHEDTILELQEGKNKTLRRQLESAGLIFNRHVRSTETYIKFFVAITLEDGGGNEQVEADVVKVIREELHRLRKHLKFTSVYRGAGFCHILIKAQVTPSGYYTISPFIETIVAPFQSRRARTETYLVRGRDHIVGSETIGPSTFIALEGVHTYTRAVLRELYEDLSIPRDVRSRISRFFEDKVRRSPSLTQRDIKLLHDYTLAFARRDIAAMKEVIFRFYNSFEEYLVKNHQLFIGMVAKCQPREVYEATHISNSDKLTLGNLLTIYSYVTKNHLNDPKLFSGSDDLTKLRNDIFHPNLDVLMVWDSVLERLLHDTGKIRAIIQVVERLTGREYTGD